MLASTVRRIGLDILLWSAMPVLFLCVYVGHFNIPATAIGFHLRCLAAVFMASCILRVVLCILIPQRPARLLLTALAGGIVVTVLLLYYFLVLVGLQSWSKVISWELIASYLPQVGELVRILQVPPAGAVAGLLVPFLAATGVLWLYLRRFDWAGGLVDALPVRRLLLPLVSAVAFLCFEAWHFVNSVYAVHYEPFSLTIFPEHAAVRVDSNRFDNLRTAALDARQDHARQTYRIDEHARKKNVILIVVDALRPSNMGLYGYQRPTTPFLSSASAPGQPGQRLGMRASCAESACGLLSISASISLHEFSSRPFTLPQVLKRYGYQVHMILGGDHTNFYGLRKLYGEVDSYSDGATAKGFFANDDRFVIERTAALPRASAAPTMFQFHLMSAHGLGKRLPEFARFAPAATYISRPNKPTAAAGHVDQEWRNHYDNGVVQTDAVIASILSTLQTKGYLEEAIVVVTADHGEALGEHGLHAHSNGVYEELLRIPFVMLNYGAPMPSLASGHRNASQVDIAPTILAALGMPLPASWSGTPLQTPGARQIAYFHQGSEAGLVDSSIPGQVWKYWRNERTGQEYVFELGTDPKELHNLAAKMSADRKNAWRRALLSLH